MDKSKSFQERRIIMMKFKKILSALMAVCLLLSVLPTVSLATDTSALHNYTAAEGYHLFTDLPTAEAPATTADIYWGAAFDGVFHGMSGASFSSGATTTSTDVTAQNKIAIIYGGEDETYGTYYYLTYTCPDGTAYTFAYSGGYFSQNMLTDGLPSGGWAAKHKLFYNAEQHIFFHRPSADMTVMKALKISASSFKFFTDTVAKVLADGTYPVRLYTTCTSDNVAGKNDTHQWSGSCKYDGCDTKFDYKERINIVDPDGYHQFDMTNLPTEGHSVTNLYLGAAFEANGAFYGMSSTASSNAYPTSAVLAEQCTLTVHYGGNDATYGDYYYVEFKLPSGVSYALAYASGYFTQNKIQDDGLPSGGWAAKHRMFFDADYEFFYHRPSADMTVMKGLKISAASQKLFTETVENLRIVSEDYSPARLFEACTSDNVAGTDDIYVWTGTCDCGYLFDYQVKPTPDSYHVCPNLPTAENPEITGLSLGGNVELDGEVTFFGLNAASAVGEDGNRYFTTATAAQEQCVITVRYAGTDTLYGDYYHVIFRIPGGASYALAYAGGYFSQNKLTDGEPADGWAQKHDMFFDAEGQFFYYVIETETEIVKKGLKLSASSQKIFTETVENLKTENAAYVPVRLYEPCVSDNVAGKGAAGRWSGACQCGYKFDLTADPMVVLPGGHHEFTNLPTAASPETNETLHMGIGLVTDGEAVFYGMSGSFDADHAATTSADAAKQYIFRVIYGGNDETYGDYYYVIYNNLDGTEYAFAYASGYLSQNKILETGEPTDGWQYKHRLYFDQDGQFFYHRPSNDMTVMKGIKISTTSYNLFTEKVENLKADNEIYPVRLYVVCSSDNVAGSNDTHHWSGSCSCGYLFDYEENYVVDTRAPQAGTAYFWGVTQLDAEGQPSYFFSGEKLTSTFNTQTDMLTSTAVYVDVVDGGYTLYFLNDSNEKQYICLGKDAANGYATFIAIEADAANATVFTWNEEHSTFVATVVKNAEGETVDMVLGAYTSGETAYTKISALTLSHLAQEHYFASHLYVKHMAHEYDESKWIYDAESHWNPCFCGSKKNEAAHSFSGWVLAEETDGKIYRTCSCGYVEEGQLDSSMPTFSGKSISLKDDFSINFYVDALPIQNGDYKDPYVIFTINGVETKVTTYTRDADLLIFAIDKLAPDMMGTTVYATFHATAPDGSDYAFTTEYSIARYCYDALALEDSSNELRALLVDILNFGAAAQLYRNSTDKLVNADLTEEQRAYGTTGELRALTNIKELEKTVDTPTASWYGVSALMGNAVRMRLYFRTEDITGLTIHAVGTSGDEWTLGAEDMMAKDGMYCVTFGHLNPAQMGEEVEFTIYNGETAISDTLHYSLESYAAVMLDKADASQEMKNLADAMIRYGDAAKAYAALDKRTVTEEVQLAAGVTKYAITYDVFGVRTKAYAVVVDAESTAQVMTVAAPWDETNNEENPVELYTVFEYRNQLKDQGKDVLAITNGGFFHLSAGSNLPWGMQIINGEVLQEPSKDSLAYSDNWFGVTTDGDYVISNTDGYNNTYKGNILYGIGGGKLLMKDGVRQSVSGSDSYRTCVGITENGDLIILCLETCNYDMAVRAFTDLNMGVKTILNLDGGGSTTLYTGDVRWQTGYDICGDGWWPRDIADAIAIVAG